LNIFALLGAHKQNMCDWDCKASPSLYNSCPNFQKEIQKLNSKHVKRKKLTKERPHNLALLGPYQNPMKQVQLTAFTNLGFLGFLWNFQATKKRKNKDHT
jgi:hypothetical protein